MPDQDLVPEPIPDIAPEDGFDPSLDDGPPDEAPTVPPDGEGVDVVGALPLADDGLADDEEAPDEN